MIRYVMERLEKMMHHASRDANDQLLHELAKQFLFQMEEDMRAIHERLEQLERLIKMLIETKSEQKKKEPFKLKNISIPYFAPNIDEEKMAKISQAIENVMKANTLRTYPMTKVELPEMKGADDK
jgi:hypothetical protein